MPETALSLDSRAFGWSRSREWEDLKQILFKVDFLIWQSSL
jgi:hypothetical protein